MASIKIKRISSSIAKEISDILSNEARDYVLHKVTITACEVTNDLSFAKVYFTSMDDTNKKDILKDLNEAAGFIRKCLSEKIDIRHTPKLIFVYDESIEYGDKIEKIIKEIHGNDGK